MRSPIFIHIINVQSYTNTDLSRYTRHPTAFPRQRSCRFRLCIVALGGLVVLALGGFLRLFLGERLNIFSF